MTYLIISYPKILKKDYDWIQLIRKKFDRSRYKFVEPHITFLFGTDKLEPSELIMHAKKKLEKIKPFSIKLDSVRVVEDNSGEFFHVFLVPSIGFNDIKSIHSAVYSGPLEGELRTDILFIPHVGIGADKRREKMEQLSESINLEKIVVNGVVDELVVVEYDGEKLFEVEVISLKHN